MKFPLRCLGHMGWAWSLLPPWEHGGVFQKPQGADQEGRPGWLTVLGQRCRILPGSLLYMGRQGNKPLEGRNLSQSYLAFECQGKKESLCIPLSLAWVLLAIGERTCVLFAEAETACCGITTRSSSV